MKTTWIEPEIPPADVWATPEEGGLYPPELEMQRIARCLNGHQWWVRISSPQNCPECNDYHIQRIVPNGFQWLWHLLREAMRGIPVVTHYQFVTRRMEDEEKQGQESG